MKDYIKLILSGKYTLPVIGAWAELYCTRR